MKDQLFVPEKIKVGYQNRYDTYTKKLGFVVILEKNGNVRQPKAWEGWRDKKIEPSEYENIPTEGFVINKDVGGVRRSWSHYGRMEKVRIYDPRDFEIEITVENLLFILQESNSIKGKGLEGKFVYGWNKNSLALIPVESEEYKNCIEFTELQSGKVTKKSLTPGCTYRTKHQNDLIYLGRFDWYTWNFYKKENIRMVSQSSYLGGDYETCDYYQGHDVTKKFVFLNIKTQQLTPLKAITSLSKQVTDTSVDNLAELIEWFYKTTYGSKPIKIEAKPVDVEFEDRYKQGWEDVVGTYVKHIADNKYYYYEINSERKYIEIDRSTNQWKTDFKGFNVFPSFIYEIRNENEVIVRSYDYYNDNSRKVLYNAQEVAGMGFSRFFVTLESGAEYQWKDYTNRYY